MSKDFKVSLTHVLIFIWIIVLSVPASASASACLCVPSLCAYLWLYVSLGTYVLQHAYRNQRTISVISSHLPSCLRLVDLQDLRISFLLFSFQGRSTGVMNSCYYIQLSMGSGDRTQVLTLVKQVFYPLNHLYSHVTVLWLYFNHCLLNTYCNILLLYNNCITNVFQFFGSYEIHRSWILCLMKSMDVVACCWFEMLIFLRRHSLWELIQDQALHLNPVI